MAVANGRGHRADPYPPDPTVARERLMDRDWPAKDVAPLIALIDDPRHKISEDGTFRLSDEQARAIPALDAGAADGAGARRNRRRTQRLGADIAEYLDILRSRERVMAAIASRTDRDQGAVQHAARPPSTKRRGTSRTRT